MKRHDKYLINDVTAESFYRSVGKIIYVDVFPEQLQFIDYGQGTTPNTLKALGGSGGNYLSNEINYRVSYLRSELKSSKYTGHIHIGFLNFDYDPHTSDNRDMMLEDLISMIKKFLNDNNI